MPTPVFDFPLAEFCWYGAASLLSLYCFASLSWETQRGLAACRKIGDEDAWKVVWTTYHVNFITMVLADAAYLVSLIGMCIAESGHKRLWLATSILACGAYWSYTRACEARLLQFLHAIGAYP